MDGAASESATVAATPAASIRVGGPHQEAGAHHFPPPLGAATPIASVDPNPIAPLDPDIAVAVDPHAPIQPISRSPMVAQKVRQQLQEQQDEDEVVEFLPPPLAGSKAPPAPAPAKKRATKKKATQPQPQPKPPQPQYQQPPSSAMPAVAAAAAPPQIGARIAKIFPGWGLYVGEVVTRIEDLWHVRYEDGEEEGLERKQVEAGQKLLEYAEAEITTQARNSRLRLREQGLLTDAELHKLEAEEEVAEQERKASQTAAAVAAAEVAAEAAAVGAPLVGATHEGKEEGEKKEDNQEGEEDDDEVEIVEVVDETAATAATAAKPKRKRQPRANPPKKGGGAGEAPAAPAKPKAEVKENPTKSPVNLPTCKACGCNFTSEHGLKYHQDKGVCISFRARDIRAAAPGQEIPPCPICQRKFPSSNCLRYHLERADPCAQHGDDETVQSIVAFYHKARERKRYPRKQSRKRESDDEGGEEGSRGGGGGGETVIMTRRGGVPSRRAAIVGSKKTAKVAQKEGKRKRAGLDSDASSEEEEEEEEEEWAVGSGKEEEEEEEDDEDVSDDDDGTEASGGGRKGRGQKRPRRGTKLSVLKGKCRLNQSNVRLVLPGLEGTIYTGFPPSAVEGAAIEAALETDLSVLRHLVARHAEEKEEEEETQQARPEGMGVDMWLLENGVEVGTLPLRVVGPENAVAQVDIPPFQCLPSPFPTLTGGAIDTLVNAGGPVQSIDLLTVASGGGGMYAAVGTSSLAKKAASATDMDLFLNATGTPSLHVKGRATHAPNLLQVWDMGATPNPRMVYAVAHTFGAVWDCRWLPSEQLLVGGRKDVLGALLAVFGDGKARVYLLPTPKQQHAAEQPPVLHLSPLLELEPPAGACLTCARLSPHDPGLVLCGATNGMVLVYSMDTTHATKASTSRNEEEEEEEEKEVEPRVQVLKPVRRFVDGRENTTPILSAVDVVAWHPTQPQLFMAGGHDYNMRLWDMKKTFCPVVEKGLYRHCHAAAFLPNGVGCLGGFTNGAVRVLGLPEDVVRVRLYRHEASVHDGVAALDSLYSKRHACVVVTSTGADGKFAMCLLDKDGLIPKHNRENKKVKTANDKGTNYLLTLMNLQAPTDEALQAGGGGGGGGDAGRLTCELLSLKAGLRGEAVEVSPTGKVERPVRVGLTTTRVVLDAAGEPFAAAGGFSGLCRFVSLKHLLP